MQVHRLEAGHSGYDYDSGEYEVVYIHQKDLILSFCQRFLELMCILGEIPIILKLATISPQKEEDDGEPPLQGMVEGAQVVLVRLCLDHNIEHHK